MQSKWRRVQFVTPYFYKYLEIISRVQRMLSIAQHVTLRGASRTPEQRTCFPGKQVPLHIDEEIISHP